MFPVRGISPGIVVLERLKGVVEKRYCLVVLAVLVVVEIYLRDEVVQIHVPPVGVVYLRRLRRIFVVFIIGEISGVKLREDLFVYFV